MATKTKTAGRSSKKKRGSTRQRTSGKRESVKRSKTTTSETARRQKPQSRGTTGSTRMVKAVRKTARRGLKTARQGLATAQLIAGKAVTAAKLTAMHAFEEVKAKVGR